MIAEFVFRELGRSKAFFACDCNARIDRKVNVIARKTEENRPPAASQPAR
jgi:hypothetical protein